MIFPGLACDYEVAVPDCASGRGEILTHKEVGMSRKSWIREEDLAVLYLKVEYHGQLTPVHPAVHALADAMGRTVASVWMRKGNFDSLDPSVPGSGLSNAAKLTVDIWAEYERSPERVLSEARRAYLALV